MSDVRPRQQRGQDASPQADLVAPETRGLEGAESRSENFYERTSEPRVILKIDHRKQRVLVTAVASRGSMSSACFRRTALDDYFDPSSNDVVSSAISRS